jgi:hypothetical protein
MPFLKEGEIRCRKKCSEHLKELDRNVGETEVELLYRIPLRESGTLLIFKVIGQGHRVKFLPHNILVNTLESTSFNGF